MAVEDPGQDIVEVGHEQVVQGDLAAVRDVEDEGARGAVAVCTAGKVGEIDYIGTVGSVLSGEIALDAVGPLRGGGLGYAGLLPAAPHRRAEFLELRGEVVGVARSGFLYVEGIIEYHR